MNNYSVLTYNTDYNPAELSSKTSCYNMSVLSSQYTNKQNNIFSNNFNIENCQKYHDYQNNVDNIKNNESGLLKGFNINKKSCIYKRPEYGMGVWEKQYSGTLKDSPNIFDINTQAKNNNGIICDYTKISLCDEIDCSNDKYELYSKTFENNSYNYII